MRYLSLAQTKALLADRVACAPTRCASIAWARCTQAVAACQSSTGRAIPLTAVAATADHLLDMTTRTVEQTGRQPHRQALSRCALPPKTHRAILLAPVASTVTCGIGTDLAVWPDTARPLARRPIYAENPNQDQPQTGLQQGRSRRCDGLHAAAVGLARTDVIAE